MSGEKITAAVEAARLAVELESERGVKTAVLASAPTSYRDAAMARGAEPDALAAAFVLACAVEFTSPDNTWPVTKALNAYWRSIGIEP